jgi:hypothetical protein
MNFKKIIAAIVTGALALSTMAISASAANLPLGGGSNSEWMKWNANDSAYIVYVNDVAGDQKYDVTGINIYFSGDFANVAAYGQVAWNGAGCGWTLFADQDWGANAGAGKIEAHTIGDDGMITYQNGTPLFTAADDAYMMIYLQCFVDKPAITLEGIDLLAADGSVIVSDYDPAAAPAETEAAPAETEAAPAETEAAPAEEPEAVGTEAAPAVEEATPAETEAAPAETEAAPVEEAAPAVEEAAPETEAAPAETEPAPVETTVVVVTDAPATGNVPVIVVGSVMVLALAGAVISRKRK